MTPQIKDCNDSQQSHNSESKRTFRVCKDQDHPPVYNFSPKITVPVTSTYLTTLKLPLKCQSYQAFKENLEASVRSTEFREKMMCIILLLINLTSCVCGVSKPYDTPLKYQAEENSDVTVEWSFSSETDIPLPSLKIHCQKVLGLKVFYHLDNCIEESQHEQFAGRVQCDKDALRGGRVRLHLSRVKMNDSGVYLCRMATDFGRKVKVFSLDITAAVDKPKPVTPTPAPVTPTPAPVSQGRISLYVVLGLAAAAVLVLLAVLAVRRCSLKSCRTMKMCSVAHQ
ncbi:hypothetical protein ABVT39_018549 [Epinephelus coioides]